MSTAVSRGLPRTGDAELASSVEGGRQDGVAVGVRSARRSGERCSAAPAGPSARRRRAPAPRCPPRGRDVRQLVGEPVSSSSVGRLQAGQSGHLGDVVGGDAGLHRGPTLPSCDRHPRPTHSLEASYRGKPCRADHDHHGADSGCWRSSVRWSSCGWASSRSRWDPAVDADGRPWPWSGQRTIDRRPRRFVGSVGRPTIPTPRRSWMISPRHPAFGSAHGAASSALVAPLRLTVPILGRQVRSVRVRAGRGDRRQRIAHSVPANSPGSQRRTQPPAGAVDQVTRTRESSPSSTRPPSKTRPRPQDGLIGPLADAYDR